MISYFKWLCLCTYSILYLKCPALTEGSPQFTLEDSSQASPSVAGSCDSLGLICTPCIDADDQTADLTEEEEVKV